MNMNPDIASDWKGQVLLHVKAVENDKPKKIVETMDPEIKKKAVDLGFFEKDEYNILCEVGQGITLPEADKKYKVMLSIEDHNWITEEPKETKGEYARWSCRSELLSWKMPRYDLAIFSKSEEELGLQRHYLRLYFYLVDEDNKPICFWHGILGDFINPNAQWKWI